MSVYPQLVYNRGLGQLAVAQLAMADWPQPNWPQGTTGHHGKRERERIFFNHVLKETSVYFFYLFIFF